MLTEVYPELAQDSQGRAIYDGLYSWLISALKPVHPTFSRLNPQAILVVAGGARRDTLASIRPFSFGGSPPSFQKPSNYKPQVLIGSQRPLYEICLRPGFFLHPSGSKRLQIFIHELWHIGPGFDGSLATEHRHGQFNEGELEDFCKTISNSISNKFPKLIEALNYRGELRMQAWRNRPPSLIPHGRKVKDSYSEADLYSAIIEQA